MIEGEECKYLSKSIVVNGLWKALLTSSTSIINEGKGKVFVTVSFIGVSQQVTLVNVQNDSRKGGILVTKMLCSNLSFSMEKEAEG